MNYGHESVALVFGPPCTSFNCRYNKNKDYIYNNQLNKSNDNTTKTTTTELKLVSILSGNKNCHCDAHCQIKQDISRALQNKV